MGHRRGRRVAREVLARSKRSGPAAKYKAPRRLVARRRGRGHGREHWERIGGARPRAAPGRGAYPGHPPQKRTPAAHTGPRRHAAPAPPRTRVTLTFLPPPGQPGPAPARKAPRGSAPVRVEGLRGPVLPQPPEAKPKASPAASSGPLGDVDGGSLAAPFCTGASAEGRAEHRLSSPRLLLSEATHTPPTTLAGRAGTLLGGSPAEPEAVFLAVHCGETPQHLGSLFLSRLLPAWAST